MAVICGSIARSFGSRSRLAALDDGGRDGRAVDVGERLRGEDDAGVLLAQRLQPFAELAGEALVVEREPALVDDERVGDPSRRSSMRWKR
jgi:hypothetical protein